MTATKTTGKTTGKTKRSKVNIDVDAVSVSASIVASIGPTLDELERAIRWATARMDWTSQPTPLVPVTQTKGRRSNCLGYFAAERWSTKEGEFRAELQVSSEFLNRDPVEIVGTIIHEVVHVWCHAHGVKECGGNGRHNSKCKPLFESVGLDVADPVDWYGFGYTTVNDALRNEIEQDFQPDLAAFNLYRRTITNVKKKGGPPKRVKWQCSGCESSFMGARATEFHVMCVPCANLYERVD